MASRDDFHRNAERLAAAARPSVENVLVFQHVDSTHACVLRLIEQAEAEEIVLPTTLIIALEQDQGQGRAGRQWVSPEGGLYLNWVSTNLDPTTMTELPMIAAAAAHEAIGRLGIENMGIKWPNDLLVDGRKLAGCLVHARHGSATWVTVGLGINIEAAPTILDESEVRTTAVADLASGGSFATWAESITRVFADELASGVADSHHHLARWRDELLHRTGDEMVVRGGNGSQIRGHFAGLTDDGHLRLDVAGDERIISTGDVIE